MDYKENLNNGESFVRRNLYCVKDNHADPRATYGELLLWYCLGDGIPDKYIDTGIPYRHQYFFSDETNCEKFLNKLWDFYKTYKTWWDEFPIEMGQAYAKMILSNSTSTETEECYKFYHEYICDFYTKHRDRDAKPMSFGKFYNIMWKNEG